VKLEYPEPNEMDPYKCFLWSIGLEISAYLFVSPAINYLYIDSFAIDLFLSSPIMKFPFCIFIITLCLSFKSSGSKCRSLKAVYDDVSRLVGALPIEKWLYLKSLLALLAYSRYEESIA
jgi:hypothetical protein